jgi:hypothetical protein
VASICVASGQDRKEIQMTDRPRRCRQWRAVSKRQARKALATLAQGRVHDQRETLLVGRLVEDVRKERAEVFLARLPGCRGAEAEAQTGDGGRLRNSLLMRHRIVGAALICSRPLVKSPRTAQGWQNRRRQLPHSHLVRPGKIDAAWSKSARPAIRSCPTSNLVPPNL